MSHDLTAARKNARADEDAAAIAWAQDEIERLRWIEDEAQLVVDEIRRSGTHAGWKMLAEALEKQK